MSQARRWLPCSVETMATSPPAQGADQLHSVDPATWPVAAGWQPLVADFFSSPVGCALLEFLGQRLRAGASVFPPQPLRALELTAPEAVRVVILGQDPYHGRGQAEGLAFSVAPGVALPPSLRNILRELQRDLGTPFPAFPHPGGSLVRWARHGVLLLNSCLTVEEGKPASHCGRGWEQLTDAVIRQVSRDAAPAVFMLWGAHAQGKRNLIDTERHRVLMANHPSPLSALRGPVPFLGCGHFSQAREWREQHAHGGLPPNP